ncbi:MAG: hypothetical protein M1136_10335 [Chloroflexi bacterium]|nr:hypothetical protein [Chloroflexota bacterium]MCL5076028.1 hypothetical protein [Chloroflexota bacterium]
MEGLKAGYNLVERALIGQRYEDASEVMSIVQFLRHLESGENLPRRFKVTGLDRLMAAIDDSGTIRSILYEAGEKLLRRSPVVLFPVDKLTMDAEPKMYWRNQEIRLRPLFGNRLEPQGVGYFYSPFNIP